MMDHWITRGFFGGTVIAASLFLSTPLRAENVDDGVVEVIFTPEMTMDAMLRIKEELKAKDVRLDFTRTDFKDGRLHALAIAVITDKGEGTASADIVPEHRFGFRYDPRPGAEVPFSIGRLGGED